MTQITGELLRASEREAAIREANVRAGPIVTVQLGWWPALALWNAGCLLVVSLVFHYSRAGVAEVYGLYWASLLALVVPALVRLLAAEASRSERIALVVMVALSLYLVKVLHSPTQFLYGDEFIHAYNAVKIGQVGTLYTPNTILPATALFPGLASLTAALQSLSGADVFVVGLIVIAAARLVMAVSLFLLYEQVGRSARLAGLGVIIYMSSPNFLYWSAQYAYESLALPLALMTLFALVRRERRSSNARGASRLGLTVLGLAGILAVVVTHHLSSYFLVIFLCAWVLAEAALRWLRQSGTLTYGMLGGLGPRGRRSAIAQEAADHVRREWALSEEAFPRSSPRAMALFALLAAGGWMLYVATITVGYLSPLILSASRSIVEMILGEIAGRELFVSSSGSVAPLWERLTGLAAVGLSLLGTLFGLWRWRDRLRKDAVVLVFAGGALLYYFLLTFRLSSVFVAWEIANRSSEFLYVGLAVLCATGIASVWDASRWRALARGVVLACVAILYCGGVIAGWSPQLRLAPAFQVSVEDAVLEPPAVAVADWVRVTLGPDQRMAASVSDGRFLLLNGDQQAFEGRYPNVKDLLSEPGLEERQLALLQEVEIAYVLMDRRLVSWDTMLGQYFVDVVYGGRPASETVFAPEIYTKLDGISGIGRMLDGGDLVLYDVTGWRHAQP